MARISRTEPISGATDFPLWWLVLEAAYEATVWAALDNARRFGPNIVPSTLLGGGVFGNDTKCIFAAIRRALGIVSGRDLDVRLVSYGPPSSELIGFVENSNRHPIK
jgi:hypothetical protein